MFSESHTKIEVVRPPSMGGQTVGAYNYPIRITHLPTGTVAECSAARSQHQNRRVAMLMLEFAVTELEGLTT